MSATLSFSDDDFFLIRCDILVENDPTRALPVNDIQTFVQTAPGPVSPSPNQRVNERDPQPPAYLNPQTEAFCRMLGIENKINSGASRGDGSS